jgi:hypothetical protein
MAIPDSHQEIRVKPREQAKSKLYPSSHSKQLSGTFHCKSRGNGKVDGMDNHVPRYLLYQLINSYGVMNVMDKKRNGRHFGKVVTSNMQTTMPNFYVWRERTALSHVQFQIW